MAELIDDLRALVERHEKKPRPAITRWIPICEGYADAKWAEVCEERGGDTVTRGKNGQQVKVLAWIKVYVAFDGYSYKPVQVLDQLTSEPM